MKYIYIVHIRTRTCPVFSFADPPKQFKRLIQEDGFPFVFSLTLSPVQEALGIAWVILQTASTARGGRRSSQQDPKTTDQPCPAVSVEPTGDSVESSVFTRSIWFTIRRVHIPNISTVFKMGIPVASKISFHLIESVNYSSNLCFIKMKFVQNNNHKRSTQAWVKLCF